MNVLNVGTPILREIAETLKKVAEPTKPKQPETRGAKPKHPWDRAVSAVWAKVAWRGEVTPKNQAEVGKLLVDWFNTNCGGYVPAPSEIDERAKIIWTDMKQE
jgi:hypothetical protein